MLLRLRSAHITVRGSHVVTAGKRGDRPSFVLQPTPANQALSLLRGPVSLSRTGAL